MFFTFGCNKPKIENTDAKTVLSSRILGNKVEAFTEGDKIRAGTSLFFDINTTAAKEECSLIWRSVFGDHLLKGDLISKGVIRFYIPKELTNKSGFVNVLIYEKGELIQNSELFIDPLEAVGKSESFLGPRSLIIDKDQKTMMSVIPLDKFRNPMPDNYPTRFNFKYPKEKKSSDLTKVQDFVAYKYFLPSSKIGKLYVAANSGSSNSQEEEILIEAGHALDFNIEVEDLYPYADSRQHVVLKSSKILDAYGNSIADGTLINFLIIDKSGKRSYYNAFSIGGIVKVAIENPSVATQWNIQASLYGSTKSNQLKLNFISTVVDFEMNLDGRTLIVGPVIGILGQIIRNGTKAEVILNDETYEVELIDGKVIYEIPENLSIDQKMDLKFTILGKTKNLFNN